MWQGTRLLHAAGALAIVASLTACETPTITYVDTLTVRDTIIQRDTVRLGNTNLVFNQIERLGNPLVSEVLFEKRIHGFHNSTNPRTDVANFTDDVVKFMTTVAGRDEATARTLASVLLPDMLLVFPNRAAGVTAAGVDGAASVGWLTWTPLLGNGYGGRKLDNDDAVDKGLAAIFGPLLSPNNVSPGLASDNVGDPRNEPNTFPYLAAP